MWLGTMVVFFFKQKTAYEMRISDWSSDVCSSDLGIVIGVAAVVTMVTLGNATSAAVQQSIANLGTNILQIYPSGGLRRGGGGSRPTNFKPADVTAIGQQVAGVTGVAPQAQTSATVIRDGPNWSTTIFGMDDVYFEVQPWPLARPE